MQASITGHLVFSTLHTQNTIGTVFRLLDLGTEPYLVAQAMQLVIAQRLVKQLCPFCKMAVKPTSEQMERLDKFGENIDRIYSPSGCPKCLNTGFSGRRGSSNCSAAQRRVTRSDCSFRDSGPTSGDCQ